MEIISEYYKDLVEKEEHKQEILKYLSWLVKPFSFSFESGNITNILRYDWREVDEIMEELENEMKIFSITPENSRFEEQHIVKPDVQLRLLMDIKKNKTKPAYALNQKRPASGNWKVNEWVFAIQDFIMGKKNKDHERLHFSEHIEIRYLLMMMPTMKEWVPFFRLIPPRKIEEIFYNYKTLWANYMVHPSMDCMNDGYFNNETLPADVREKYKTEFDLYKYVYSGRINEIPEHVPGDIAEGKCLHAIYHLYKGGISEPLQLFKESLRGQNSTTFDNALLNLYYVIALINDSTAESKKTMEKLFKSAYVSNDLLPAQLLALHHLNEELDYNISTVYREFEDYAPLVKVLTALVMQRYHLDAKKKINNKKTMEELDDEGLKLLQLECSEDFAPFISQADQLKKELGLSPILPPYEKMDEWERVLTLLMTKAKEMPQKEEKSKSESLGRIVYRIASHGWIIPYLQKSKDGKVWSKGRSVSLSSFLEGMPEMNELDRKVATYIKRRLGSCNEKNRWLLEGVKPMLELAGYPLVFSDEKPDQRLTIRREVPEVTVKKVKDGFQIKGNIPSNRIIDDYVQIKENNIIRIIELSLFQRDVMIAIARISFIPQEGEKQLTEMLRELSKNIVVHSELIEGDKK